MLSDSLNSIKSYFWIFLVFCVGLSGCIREKRDACPPKDNILLAFKLDGFKEKIHKMDVAIYDSNGRFMEYIQLNKEQLNKRQGLILGLCRGRYSIAYWANAYTNTAINGYLPGSDTSTVSFYHPNILNGERIATQDSLYYTYSEIQANDEQQTVEVNLKPAFLPVRIYIDRLKVDDTGAMDKNPVIKVRNIHAVYDFKMRSIGDYITYEPPVTSVNEALSRTMTAFNVNLFGENDPVKIQIWSRANPSVLHYEFDLWDYIRENNIDLETLKPGYLPIYIAFMTTGITVTIEPWENGGGLNPDLSPGG